jgi:hypothetical protein
LPSSGNGNSITIQAVTGQLPEKHIANPGDTVTFVSDLRGQWLLNDVNTNVWDDLLPSSVVTLATGASAPAFTAYNGNLKAYEFVGTGPTQKEMAMGWQTAHKTKDSSTIRAHLHLYIPDDVVGGVIKFGMEYTFTSVGSIGAVTPTTIYGTVTVAANAGIQNNTILPFPYIDNTGKGISAMLMTRVFRDPADVGDTFGASVWLKSADLHCNYDTLGSTYEYIK